MRRPTSALTATLAAIGLSAPLAGAQQLSPPAANRASASAADLDPAMASRPARYLLRNGMDYLAYREYGRALNFLRAVEARQNELNESERKSLKTAIARAQDGLREAVNTPRVASASAKGRPKVQAGAFALAQQEPAKATATPDPVQLTAATMEMAAAAPVPTPIPAADGAAPPAFGGEPSSLPSLPPATPHAMGDGAAMPALPTEAPAPAPPPAPLGEVAAPAESFPAPAELPPADPSGLMPAVPPPIGLETVPDAAPVAPSPLPSTPEVAELPSAAPAMAGLPAAPAELPSAPAELPSAPEMLASPEPREDPATAPTLATPPAEAQEPGLPILPDDPAPAPAVPSAPSEVPSMPAPAYEAQPSAPIEPAPPPEASPAPSRPGDASAAELPRTDRAPGDLGRSTILPPRLQEEVDRIAQRQPDDDRLMVDRQQSAYSEDPNASMQPIQGSTRLDLPRAPSPTEARPLRRIPVPEDFVPLGAREWNPNRKYWAAAATCHMPLYFQDAVLERYGQSAEQALGPAGRYFSYPLDDPKQSNQRNQILQPFASIGIFCFQIGTWPYKLIVDPPWEAEYDLGYYRPGDRIPPDTIYATPTGLGPPGHGRKY